MKPQPMNCKAHPTQLRYLLNSSDLRKQTETEAAQRVGPTDVCGHPAYDGSRILTYGYKYFYLTMEAVGSVETLTATNRTTLVS
jgi:hypothetical protein